MNIYKITIARRGYSNLWNSYLGKAQNHTIAIKRALKEARREGCTQPTLHSLENLGRASF